MSAIPPAGQIPRNTRVWRGVIAYPTGSVFGPVYTTRREAEEWIQRERARQDAATVVEPTVVSAVGRRPDVVTDLDDDREQD